MANDSMTSGLRKTWETAAPGWAKWEHVFDAGFAEATADLIDMAAVGSGMRALDIACGAGSQSIQVARRVGPGGHVVASDISASMLRHVRENAFRAGVENIETLIGAADEIDETIAPFDAAICRMALMLFPSPRRALEAVRRHLRPGARFAALVFSVPANNPFLALPMTILLRHAGKPAPAPGSPGIFALGDKDMLGNLLEESGFTDIEVKTVQASIVLPSAADALHLMHEAAGAYRAVVADLNETARSRAWDEVYASLKHFESEAGFEARLEAIIASGVNPE